MTNSRQHRQMLEDILPLVEQPSRYLGNEINSIHKELNDVRLRMVLAFPDLYEIGTSHFGLQILYTLLNREKHIAAERVFAPARDFERQLRRANLPLLSLESATPLSDFDIIGFSLLYELNFTNILTILELGRIPFRARQRDLSHPLLIAGGPSTVNPEPLADFFDAIVVGDGESVMLEMARAWSDWQSRSANDKQSLLRAWSRIEGVYIPSFFEAHYEQGVYQRLTPCFSDHLGVRRRIVNSLERAVFPIDPIVPYGRPVHDRLRLEVSRGCTRGCRFCQAGMIYRPVRERLPATLLNLAQRSLASTGFGDLSLLSLSTGDYGCIAPLMERLMNRYAQRHIAVSLPSLRAGTLSTKLMMLIRQVRKTGFTIAPEAGSQRLRDVINKNISEQDIVKTVTDAFKLGWQVIKLYFMVGLPTEREEDLAAIVALVQRLRKIKTAQGRRGQLNVSVATFIPKAHTPFQWAPQISLSESRRKIAWLKDRLKQPGVKFKWQQPEVSALEGLWARGDRRLAPLLESAYKKGCRFDGWSDQFKYDIWQKALDAEGIDLDDCLTRRRGLSEPLPWDHVDVRIDSRFLKKEWQRALEGRTLGDCRDGDCHGCGVCDFERVAPETFGADTLPEATAQQSAAPAARYQKRVLTYRKQGPARFLGHLEMANVFFRALQRGGIQVEYSQGFHPKPRISFEDPLPIGMESLQERLFLSARASMPCREIIARLNAQLPEGLAIETCAPLSVKPAELRASATTYRMTLTNAVFDRHKLAAYEKRADFKIVRAGRKRALKTIDLKIEVLSIAVLDSSNLEMTTRTGPGKMVRPYDVAAAVFEISDQVLKRARVVKLPVSAPSLKWQTGDSID